MDQYSRAVEPPRVYQVGPSYPPYVQGLGIYDPLGVFLSHLKYDLSPWYVDLRSKGLGTMEQLYILSSWEEKHLDRIFAALLPSMPETYRYTFIQGIVGLVQYRTG